MRSVLWENALPGGSHAPGPAFEIHRLKGHLILKDGGEKMVQGVREVFEIFDNPTPSSSEEGQREGKLVLIGRYLVDYDFRTSIEEFIGIGRSSAT